MGVTLACRAWPGSVLGVDFTKKIVLLSRILAPQGSLSSQLLEALPGLGRLAPDLRLD